MLEKINSHDIILASKSPRRQHLLAELGVKFRIAADVEIDETCPAGMDPSEITLFLARKKAAQFRERLHKKSVLITADTIVWFQQEVMPKPSGRDEAKHMLRRLSGHIHEVYTGVNVKSFTKEAAFFSRTAVHFKELMESEISYYVDVFSPLDKAGAYGIQEWIGYVGVERIEGSFYNVMGLPVQQLFQKLVEFVSEAPQEDKSDP
ncbi:MAG: septum formation protein Maf [Bacteroidales bacterium]|nr:septum formation protein Maf [Bacteroidales bacterium]